ncbi:MAG: hypothetical protein FJW61_03610 [Actinobacteria bacterium]|nr:hypothetical protein [Actinomycetota bacterium]
MKIFLDTNVIISAFITHGYASELMEYCFIHHKIYTSGFIIEEVDKNLNENFNCNNKEVSEVVDFIRSNFTNVEKYKKPNKTVPRDADDDNVPAAAAFKKVDV